eukprot:CAMPEP_0170626228 /NCGR_PEP_ID=MMETSP0224-20130122/31235_1 /TAXON_ID=285029 /ORGANISM="Togula jolla, Strain CCCM 725" /LENGTH=99 /DNA_ID=CAMNT_0010952965 /DNA_START=307 /DNA_END=607 /DNA_ORIENTATION=+
MTSRGLPPQGAMEATGAQGQIGDPEVVRTLTLRDEIHLLRDVATSEKHLSVHEELLTRGQVAEAHQTTKVAASHSSEERVPREGEPVGLVVQILKDGFR